MFMFVCAQKKKRRLNKKELWMWRFEVASKLVFLGRLKNEKRLYSKKIFRLKRLHTRYYIKQCLIVRIQYLRRPPFIPVCLELNDLVSIQCQTLIACYWLMEIVKFATKKPLFWLQYLDTKMKLSKTSTIITKD